MNFSLYLETLSSLGLLLDSHENRRTATRHAPLCNIGLADVIVCHRVGVAGFRTVAMHAITYELQTDGTTFCPSLIHIYKIPTRVFQSSPFGD